MGQQRLHIALVLADQVDAQLGHGQVGFAVAFVDGQRFSLKPHQRIIATFEPFQALTHAIERPGQVDRGGPGRRQQGEVLLQRRAPFAAGGQAQAGRQHHAIGGADTDGRRTTHHHRANRLSNPCRISVGLPGFLVRQFTLIQQMQGAISPIDGLNLLRSQ
ncbi:hypothetical protein D9M71_600250 [compost metagenome]